jgi:hypothetical protein
VGTTTDGQTKELATNLAVRAGQITKFDTLGEMASIIVHAPNVKGLAMKAVYALKADTNQIHGKVEAWEVPMLVSGGTTYDIALEQSAGLTRIKTGITPGTRRTRRDPLRDEAIFRHRRAWSRLTAPVNPYHEGNRSSSEEASNVATRRQPSEPHWTSAAGSSSLRMSFHH